jgi:hypothetical protein
MENYVGKLVFVENTGAPNYNVTNGEYIVVEQSPNNLFGISTRGGAHSREIKTISLLNFNVVSSRYDPKFIKEFAAGMRAFGEAPARGAKTEYVASVYSDILATVRYLDRIVKEDEVELNTIIVLHFRAGKLEAEQIFNFYDGQFPGLVIEDGTGD